MAEVGFGGRGGDFGGEEGVGVEGGFLAADAALVEFEAAHGEADAAFDLGGQFGQEVAAFVAARRVRWRRSAMSEW